eukprot:422077-Prymnesium_polylepis.1
MGAPPRRWESPAPRGDHGLCEPSGEPPPAGVIYGDVHAIVGPVNPSRCGVRLTDDLSARDPRAAGAPA